MAASYLMESEAVGCDEIWSTGYVNDMVYSGGLDGHLRCYNAASSKEQPCASSPCTSSSSGRPLGIVSLDATDQFVVTNQLHSELTRWTLEEDQASLRKQASKSLGSNAAWSVSLHPSEEIVATAGSGASLKLVNASVQGFGDVLHHQEETTGSKNEFALACQVSPDGKLAAVATSAGQVFLSDAASGRLVQSFPAHSKSIRTLAFSSDASLLFTGSDDRRLNIFDIRGAASRRSGGNVASIEGHPGWVLSLAARSDGKTLASGSSDGAIKLWDLNNTSSPITTLQSERDVWSLSWKQHPPPAAGFEGVGGSGVGGGHFVAGASTGLQWWRATG